MARYVFTRGCCACGSDSRNKFWFCQLEDKVDTCEEGQQVNCWPSTVLSLPSVQICTQKRSQLVLRRRTRGTSPIKPVAMRAIELGSGTVDGVVYPWPVTATVAIPVAWSSSDRSSTPNERFVPSLNVKLCGVLTKSMKTFPVVAFARLPVTTAP